MLVGLLLVVCEWLLTWGHKLKIAQIFTYWCVRTSFSVSWTKCSCDERIMVYITSIRQPKCKSHWSLDSFDLEKQSRVSEGRSIKLAVSKACLVGWVLYGSRVYSPTLSKISEQQWILRWHLEISPPWQKGSFLAILSQTMPRQKLIFFFSLPLMPLLLT